MEKNMRIKGTKNIPVLQVSFPISRSMLVRRDLFGLFPFSVDGGSRQDLGSLRMGNGVT